MRSETEIKMLLEAVKKSLSTLPQSNSIDDGSNAESRKELKGIIENLEKFLQGDQNIDSDVFDWVSGMDSYLNDFLF